MAEPMPQPNAPSDTYPDCHTVAVGASAGGVEALIRLFEALPADLDAAVFVVLHIPPHSPSQLPGILARHTGMRVRVPEDREPIGRGFLYIAPPDRHLMVDRGFVRLTRGPKEARARPSIDVLMRSAAVTCGPRAIGVVLSGMLDDGTAGLWVIKDRGGHALVQDPSEAMHRSMPESAATHVEVDLVAPVARLASEIVRLTSQPLGAGMQQRQAMDRHDMENRIAAEGNSLQLGVMNLGKMSQYTCPECHGVLVQIEEGNIVRFRCHTGHAYSIKTLLLEVNEAIDRGLWDTVRSLEERILLLHEMCRLAEQAGAGAEALQCRNEARSTQERVQAIRELVLRP